MKKILLILLLTVFAVFLAAILIDPVVTFVLKKQLSIIFKESEVSIGSCHLNPGKQLSVFDVSIKNKQAYDFLIKQVRAEFSPFSIFKRGILKVSLKNAKIYINLPQKSITDLPRYINLGSKSAFLIKTLEITGFEFDLKAKDFNANVALSFQVDLIGRTIDYLDVKIDTLGIQGFNLNGLTLKAAQGSSDGHFKINQIKYNKLNISDIESRVKLSGKELFLDGLSAKAFDGGIDGNLKINIDQDIGCGAALKFMNLDISRFINELDLKEKFEMTGRLKGDLVFESRGDKIRILNGRFLSLEPGGLLIIKDTKFLENMARNTNQSLDLLVDNFKNYHYNTGDMKLFVEHNNLVSDIVLDGETGKRDINIVLHNLQLKREGK
jgi:Dicarboxylate transport